MLTVIPLQKPQCIGVGTGDIIKGMLQPVDGQGLPLADIEALQVQIPDFARHRNELKGKPQFLGEIRQALAGGLERVHGGS